MWWQTTETVFDIFKLSIFLLISTLNLKSECIKVFDFKPNPSDPKSNIFLPFQILFEKSLVADTSKALTQKSFVFKYFRVVLILETLNIFKCSVPPLALL